MENLIDAYSQAVAGVAETIGPSVARVEGAGPHRRGGIGSGVVISDDGLVLTNSHVVAGARRLRLSFSEGGETEAVALGDDPDIRHDQPRGYSGARLCRAPFQQGRARR